MRKLRSDRKNLLGQRFGKLKVIFDCGCSTHGSSMWYCQCDCGRTSIVRGHALTSGSVFGCGQCRYLEEGESSFNALYSSYIINAKSRGYDFELTKDQCKELFTQNCFYCGAIPSNEIKPKRAKGSFIYNGIDRKNNTKGYTSDNCVSCCAICNRMKMDLSYEDFLNHIELIQNNLVSTVK